MVQPKKNNNIWNIKSTLNRWFAGLICAPAAGKQTLLCVITNQSENSAQVSFGRGGGGLDDCYSLPSLRFQCAGLFLVLLDWSGADVNQSYCFRTERHCFSCLRENVKGTFRTFWEILFSRSDISSFAAELPKISGLFLQPEQTSSHLDQNPSTLVPTCLIRGNISIIWLVNVWNT